MDTVQSMSSIYSEQSRYHDYLLAWEAESQATATSISKPNPAKNETEDSVYIHPMKQRRPEKWMKYADQSQLGSATTDSNIYVNI